MLSESELDAVLHGAHLPFGDTYTIYERVASVRGFNVVVKKYDTTFASPPAPWSVMVEALTFPLCTICRTTTREQAEQIAMTLRLST